jgi:hypothetical protein
MDPAEKAPARRSMTGTKTEGRRKGRMPNSNDNREKQATPVKNRFSLFFLFFISSREKKKNNHLYAKSALGRRGFPPPCI